MKNIWMYWESKTGKMPKYIQLCIKSVIQHKGETNFHLLNPNNILNYLPQLRPEWSLLTHPAHKADYIRTRLIYNHGGLWLDCDMVALKDLSQLFHDFPENYDYACQNIQTSIGCFMARPECALLEKVIEVQDQVLDDYLSRNTVFQWNSIGNEILSTYSTDYSHFKWKRYTLDAIAGGKISKLFSRAESIEANIHENATIFHLYNENTGPLIKTKLRDSRILDSDMLISKIFRLSLGLPTKPSAKWLPDYLLDLYDCNLLKYIRYKTK